MGIAEVVARFVEIPGAVVGRGPAHSDSPDYGVGAEVGTFLDSYPALRRDRGYVEFLELYSGARIEPGDGSIAANILGFGDVSINMTELDAPVVEDGFIVFAICVYHDHRDGQLDSYEYDFAFDVSGDRKPGVYRCFAAAQALEEPMTWYVENFTEWLTGLVEKGGRYERA